MKSKILTLIIGILIGAILATSGFLVYSKVNGKPSMGKGQMMRGNGERPQMPENMQNGDGTFDSTKRGRRQNSGTQNEQTPAPNGSASTEKNESVETKNGEA